MSAKLRASLFLLTGAIIWGLSYPINRHAIELISPWPMSGFRYMFGALSMLPMALRWRRHPAAPGAPGGGRESRRLWIWGGLLGGSMLSAGAGFQLYGLTDTTAGKASFITSLYVIMVPVLGFVGGHIPRPPVWMGLALGLAGLYLMTGGAGGGMLTRGEGLLLVGDLFWAFHVFVIGLYATRVNPWLFTFAQAATSCVLGLAMAALTGTMPDWGAFWSTIHLTAWGVMSVGVAYVMQAMGQRHIRPTATALIMQLQAVVGAVAGVIFLHEVMTGRMVLGAAVLLCGTITAQFAGAPIVLDGGHKLFKPLRFLRFSAGAGLGAGAVLTALWALAWG